MPAPSSSLHFLFLACLFLPPSLIPLYTFLHKSHCTPAPPQRSDHRYCCYRHALLLPTYRHTRAHYPCRCHHTTTPATYAPAHLPYRIPPCPPLHFPTFSFPCASSSTSQLALGSDARPPAFSLSPVAARHAAHSCVGRFWWLVTRTLPRIFGVYALPHTVTACHLTFILPTRRLYGSRYLLAAEHAFVADIDSNARPRGIAWHAVDITTLMPFLWYVPSLCSVMLPHHYLTHSYVSCRLSSHAIPYPSTTSTASLIRAASDVWVGTWTEEEGRRGRKQWWNR